ncbi:hypothetical protein, partial [Shewanella oncorhynchi]|uniref:hypothetical protein n=1 Tax=Shewanella oncorhynchi TaxID=2726434 RepID=UPI003D7923BF
AASSLNSALNVFLVVDLMCSPKVIYEVIISPLFRWPKLVCHYKTVWNTEFGPLVRGLDLTHGNLCTLQIQMTLFPKSVEPKP